MGTIRTVDHEEVEDWIMEHNGDPALDGGKLSVYFGQKELETIEWLRFFEIFEKEDLALIYDTERPGKEDPRPPEEKYDFVERREDEKHEVETEMDEGEVQENVKETS
jgi:hypothetical protein